MVAFRLFAAGVAAAGLLAAMPAAAAVKIAKYSGIVRNGYDQTGVFAAPGSDLTGYSWVATFTYDRALGGNQDTDGVTLDLSFGGPGNGGGGSPIISSTITINGVTRSIAGSWSGLVSTDTSPAVKHYAHDNSDDGTTYTYHYTIIFAFPAGAPGSLDQSFGPVAAAGAVGNVDWQTYDLATRRYTERAYADFGHEVVYSVGNAVPEPASWALLIAGFGLVGVTLRRRRVLGHFTA